MSRKPVNGMNIDFMNELDDTLKMLENNNSYRGVILTSVSFMYSSCNPNNPKPIKLQRLVVLCFDGLST